MASVVVLSIVVFTYHKIASNSSDFDSGHGCCQLEAARRESSYILYVRRKEGGTE